jgi:hypothetical protein
MQQKGQIKSPFIETCDTLLESFIQGLQLFPWKSWIIASPHKWIKSLWCNGTQTLKIFETFTWESREFMPLWSSFCCDL